MTATYNYQPCKAGGYIVHKKEILEKCMTKKSKLAIVTQLLITREIKAYALTFHHHILLEVMLQ